MNSSITQRTTCRVCGSSNLTHLFSLGEQLVSTFCTEDQVGKGIRCPITLQLCNNCTLVQQEYTAPSEFMYTRHYWYRSDTTETMRRALADIVDAAMDRVQLQPGDVVLDIGSNDGTLLRQYPKELGLVTVGVEPAINMKEEGSKGISAFYNEFWSADVFFDNQLTRPETTNLRGEVSPAEPKKLAKIITAIGMFYDLEEPNQFIADIVKVLHPEGVFIAQLMCLKQTLEMRDIGNLAHEHLEFYSLRSLNELLGEHNLAIYDIEENNINGGSYRLYIKHFRDDSKVATSRCLDAFDREEEMNLSSPEVLRQWFKAVSFNSQKLTTLLQTLRDNDKVVYVYGASTKGNVILQFANIDSELCEFACDKSKEKWNKYTCTGIQIGSEELMRQSGVDYLLVLPYSFVPEFIERERSWLEQGGKFIVPLPELHIIEIVDGQVVRTKL